IEALRCRLIPLDLRLESLGRAVLDQVGELFDETRGPRPSEIITLGEREQLFELIENEQWNDRCAGGIAQHIFAVMQEFPQRLAGRRDANLRPLPGNVCGTPDGLLDLLSR